MPSIMLSFLRRFSQVLALVVCTGVVTGRLPCRGSPPSPLLFTLELPLHPRRVSPPLQLLCAVA